MKRRWQSWLRAVAVLTLSGWLGNGAGGAPVGNLEQEQKTDDQMWQVMRQMLVEFGYSNKVAVLDSAWQKTATPQRWAAAKLVKPAEPELVPPAAARILARLPVRPAADFSQFFTDVCRQGRDLREIVRVLVAWTGRGGQAELQGRHNWTIHFIYGAACELNFGLGYFAAIMKESHDKASGDDFSFDDMAASMAGAEWVHQVEHDPQWLKQWQTGRLTLAKNLPALRYGPGAYSQREASGGDWITLFHGEYSRQIAERVHADILAAYGVHDETSPPTSVQAVLFPR